MTQHQADAASVRPAETQIELNGGKYTYVFDQGKQYALRYGEPWRDLTGDNLVYWMAAKIQELEAWRDAAFKAHPNLDLDIEAAKHA